MDDRAVAQTGVVADAAPRCRACKGDIRQSADAAFGRTGDASASRERGDGRSKGGIWAIRQDVVHADSKIVEQ